MIMISTTINRSRVPACAAALAAALVAFATPASATTAPTATLPSPVPLGIGMAAATGLSAPLSTTQCQQQLGIVCYSPAQLRQAYNLNPLYAQGITGKGVTVDILDSFGSPTIQNDLNVYDQAFDLPATTVHIHAYGTIPPWGATDPNFIGWGAETSLDVEMVHTFAPDAQINLYETGVSETFGATGFPQLMGALRSALDAGSGDVVSMSFGAAEQGFSPADDYAALTSLRGAFQDAAGRHVTLVASAGDSGAAGLLDIDGTLSAGREVAWPASDPLVTAVGGTQLLPDAAGNPQMPGVVWNEPAFGGAGGGGTSVVFSRPGYQNVVSSVVGSQRGIPDVSLSAAVSGGVWVYMSYPGNPAGGWGVFGGTSEGAPTFSAMIALATQAAGHRLGNVNDALYQFYAHGGYAPWTGLQDVTEGNNSIGEVPGYSAGPGYDLASGLGTVNADNLVRALASR